MGKLSISNALEKPPLVENGGEIVGKVVNFNYQKPTKKFLYRL